MIGNIYLNELDEWIDGQWRKFPLNKNKKSKSKLKRGIIVRFADDFIIFARKRSDAVKWFHAAKNWLKNRLRLRCSEEKSRIANLKRKTIHFLGFDIKAVKSRNNGRLCARNSIGSEEKMKIASRIKWEWQTLAKSFPARINEWSRNASRMEAYIRSTRNYNSIAHTVYKDLDEIDYRTHRARDKILRLHPKLIPLMKQIYQRACHSPPVKGANSPHRSSFELRTNVKYSIPCRKVAVNPYAGRLNIDVFQSGLDALRNKVKAWGATSVEKADICLSLFTQQRGKDPITGILLDIDSLQCHRKNPKGEYVFGLTRKRSEKLLKLWHMAH